MRDHEEIFGDYTEIDLANPGSSPFLTDDSVQTAVDSDKVNLMLNPGDLISAQYISQLPDDRENVFYGETSYNPLTVHTVDQWSDYNIHAED